MALWSAPRCDINFPPREIYHETQAYDGSVLCSQDVPQMGMMFTRSNTPATPKGKGEQTHTIKCAYYTSQQFNPFPPVDRPRPRGIPQKKSFGVYPAVRGRGKSRNRRTRIERTGILERPITYIGGRAAIRKTRNICVFQFDFTQPDRQEVLYT